MKSDICKLCNNFKSIISVSSICLSCFSNQYKYLNRKRKYNNSEKGKAIKKRYQEKKKLEQNTSHKNDCANSLLKLSLNQPIDQNGQDNSNEINEVNNNSESHTNNTVSFKGKITKDIRNYFAKCQSDTLISSNSVAKSLIYGLETNLAGNKKIDEKDYSCRMSAERSLVEGALCVKYRIAIKISKSTNLFIGFDSTSTFFDRRLLEIHLGGTDNDQLWVQPIGLKEFVDHDAEFQITMILNVWKEYNDLQLELNEQQTPIWKIQAVCTDNENLNKGKFNGIIKQLNDIRKKIHLQDKQNNSNIPDFENIVIKGCSDHLIHLISKEVHTRWNILGQNWDIDLLKPDNSISPYKNGIASLSKRIYQRFGTGSWKGSFAGFTSRSGVNVPIKKVTSVRYCAVDINLMHIYKHQHFFGFWYSAHGNMLTQQDQQDWKKLQDPDIKFLLKLVAKVTHGFYLPFMRWVAKISSPTEYRSCIKGVVKWCHSILSSPMDIFKLSDLSIVKTPDEMIKATVNKVTDITTNITDEENIDNNESEDNDTYETELDDLDNLPNLQNTINLQESNNSTLTDNKIYNRPKLEKIPCPSEEDRHKLYIMEVVKSILYILNKHDQDFMEQSDPNASDVREFPFLMTN